MTLLVPGLVCALVSFAAGLRLCAQPGAQPAAQPAAQPGAQPSAGQDVRPTALIVTLVVFEMLASGLVVLACLPA